MRMLQKLPALLLFCLATAVSTHSHAGSSSIDFTSVISAIVDEGGGSGTVTVTLHGIQVDLVVNGGTTIEAGGETVGIADLNLGDLVGIEAFFSDEGITAEEITVLESRREQFSIRGVVQATATVDDVTTLTVIGVDVQADETTDITRRAGRAGNRIPAAELAVGDVVNMSGVYEGLSLHAVRIHVGNRPQGEIEITGIIESLVPDAQNPTSLLLVIDEAAGAKATVLIDENTTIAGTLAVGVLVEVDGILDPSLQVLALDILVDEDGDGEADDDHRRGHGPGAGGQDNGPAIKKKTALLSSGDSMSGQARVSFVQAGNVARQSLEIKIEEAPTGAEYSVKVYFGSTEVIFGTLTADGEGEARIRFATGAHGVEVELAPLLPTGLSVLDISRLKILDGAASVILEGEF